MPSVIFPPSSFKSSVTLTVLSVNLGRFRSFILNGTLPIAAMVSGIAAAPVFLSVRLL